MTDVECPDTAPTILTVSGLSRRHEPKHPLVVNDLSFSVSQGELFVILGPSGCGKTSFLRVLAGFDRAESGTIHYRGELTDRGSRQLIPAENRGIGYVFQNHALFPHLTVAKNVGFGLRDMDQPRRNREVQSMLRLIGLEELSDRYPHEISGGQQQRVAIARTIAPRPPLVLLDEPFSHLDAHLRKAVREEVKGLLRRYGLTAIMVTHDQEEALSFADRVAVMHDGALEQIAPPEHVYYRPRTRFVAEFLGQTNVFHTHGSGRSAEAVFGPIPLDRAVAGGALVSIRPEHLTLCDPEPASSAVAGIVTRREFKGHDITFTVCIRGKHFLVHTDNRMPYKKGDPVRIVALEPGIVLDENGDPGH